MSESTDIQCEKAFTISTCDHCDSAAEYQIWDEESHTGIGQIEIMVSCPSHTEQVKSELQQKRQR